MNIKETKSNPRWEHMPPSTAASHLAVSAWWAFSRVSFCLGVLSLSSQWLRDKALEASPLQSINITCLRRSRNNRTNVAEVSFNNNYSCANSGSTWRISSANFTFTLKKTKNNVWFARMLSFCFFFFFMKADYCISFFFFNKKKSGCRTDTHLWSRNVVRRK